MSAGECLLCAEQADGWGEGVGSFDFFGKDKGKGKAKFRSHVGLALASGIPRAFVIQRQDRMRPSVVPSATCAAATATSAKIVLLKEEASTPKGKKAKEKSNEEEERGHTRAKGSRLLTSTGRQRRA